MKVKFIYKKEFVIERELSEDDIKRITNNGVDPDITAEADEKDNYDEPIFLDHIEFGNRKRWL